MNAENVKPFVAGNNNVQVMMRPRQNNAQNVNASEDSFFSDYKYLFFVLIKRWWIIALIAIISGILSAIYSFFFATPIYSADTTLFLYRKSDQATLLTSELSAGEQLVKDSLLIIKSDRVAQKAIQKLTTAVKPTSSSLIKNLTATSGLNTRIIKISVQDTNAADAASYANAVSEAFVEEFEKIINFGSYDRVDFVHIIDAAKPASGPIKPNKPLNIMLAIIVGIFAGVALIFVLEKLDDTLKSPEKVKAVSGLEVLGAIMYFEDNK